MLNIAIIGTALAQARHFVDCIRGKSKCLSPGTEAIKAVAVVEAMLKAARRGGVAKIRG